MKHEHWNQQQIFYHNSFTITSSQTCGCKQFICSLKRSLLAWQFRVLLQCTIYCLAYCEKIVCFWMIWFVECGLEPFKIRKQQHAAGFFLRIMLWKDTIIISRRALHWNMWQGKNKESKKPEALCFIRKEKTNSLCSVSAMRFIHTHL